MSPIHPANNQPDPKHFSCYSGKCQTTVKTSVVVLGLLLVGAGIATIFVGQQLLPQFFATAADRTIIASVLIPFGSLLAITVLVSCVVNRHLHTRYQPQTSISDPVRSTDVTPSDSPAPPLRRQEPLPLRPTSSQSGVQPSYALPVQRPTQPLWSRPAEPSYVPLYQSSASRPAVQLPAQPLWPRFMEPSSSQPGPSQPRAATAGPSQPRAMAPIRLETIRDEDGIESVIVPSQLVDRCNPNHTFSVIHDYLEQAKREITENSVTGSLDFSEHVWLLGIYHMIKEGTIDNGACHSVLKIKQHITVSDANRECDDFSTWTEKCKPVTLKNLLEGLNSFQKQRLERGILEANISPEAIPAEFRLIFTELQNMVRILQRRYPFFIDHENRQIHFLPTHTGQCPAAEDTFDHPDVKDFAELVYLRLKSILRESNLTESGHVTDDDLVDYEFIPKVCRLLAFDLISNAKIDQFGRLWFTPSICLSFLPENNDQPFIINELTSHSPTQEDNPVCAQPFELAMKLRDKSPAERQAIRDGIKNANDEEAPVPTELRGDFTALESLLQNRYFKRFVDDLSAAIDQVREGPRVPSATIVPEGVTEVNNDMYGNALQGYINTEFRCIDQDLDHAGNCGLASIFIALSRTGDHQRWFQEIRNQIAQHIRANMDEYRNNLPLGRNQTMESYIQAITNPGNWGNIQYLTEVEIEIVAGLIGRPIAVFKKNYAKIFFNEQRKLIPHTVYGREIEAEPIYLILDGVSYEPLIQR